MKKLNGTKYGYVGSTLEKEMEELEQILREQEERLNALKAKMEKI